jgi:hypothetical protein
MRGTAHHAHALSEEGLPPGRGTCRASHPCLSCANRGMALNPRRGWRRFPVWPASTSRPPRLPVARALRPIPPRRTHGDIHPIGNGGVRGTDDHSAGLPMSRPPENWAPAGRPPRAPETVHCSLCGTTQATGLMLPDGGTACADVRWYCKDVLACTQRWTARSPSARRRAVAGAPAAGPPSGLAGRNPTGRASAEPNPAEPGVADRPAEPVGVTPGEA